MLRRLSLYLPLLVTAAAAASGLSCVPEDEHRPDAPLAQQRCQQQADRADELVRKQALKDFQTFGKPCEPEILQIFPKNDAETIWKACCGQAAIQYIYFPVKCTVGRATQLIQCQSSEPAQSG